MTRPPSWRVLYELSGLPKQEFDRAVEVRSIHPEMTVEEAKGLARSRRVRIQITHQTTYVPSVGYLRGEPKPLLRHLPPVPPTHKLVTLYSREDESFLTHKPDVVRGMQETARLNEIVDAVRKVIEADLELLPKHLMQHRKRRRY